MTIESYNERMKTKFSPCEKIIEGLTKCLDDESEERLLKFRADARLQKYLDKLADKCTEGTLTPEERNEYGACVRLGTFIALWKSKIRLAKKRQS